MTLPVIVLAGATATGKSALAVGVAEELRHRGMSGEVVNADSMLVYRGMDIGTAKPTMAERRGITHHLIDIMDISESASVAVFQALAHSAIKDCLERRVVPIVVGGSALYLHAIIDRVDFPATDPDLRARLTREAEQLGYPAMYDRLRRLAPEAAQAIDPANARRVIRALESVELTGSFRSVLPAWSYAWEPVVHIGVNIGREELDRRIAERVKRMWATGFVDEVRVLCERGLRDSFTASRAIGYRQVIALLDGQVNEQQAQELTVAKTRQFSRKQLSWWRRDSRIQWLPTSATAEDVLDVADGWADALQSAQDER